MVADVADRLRLRAGDAPRVAATGAALRTLRREGAGGAEEDWAQLDDGDTWLRAPWPSLVQASPRVVSPPPIFATKTVVVAMLAFDAGLQNRAGAARLYVQRRRALEVIQAALETGGGTRAPGADALYLFETCGPALGAVLEARAALDKFVQGKLLKVRATGFGVAVGGVCEGPAVSGPPVGIAARLCYDLCGRATPGGVLLSKDARGAASRRRPFATPVESARRHQHIPTPQNPCRNDARLAES